MDLRHLFLQGLEKWGSVPLILEGGEAHTLQEMAAYTAGMVDVLQDDPSPTGAIGLLMPNSRGFIPAFYGALFAGKTPVPMNPLLPPRELIAMMEQIEAKTLLSLSPLSGLTERIEAEDAGIKIVFMDQLAEKMKHMEPEAMTQRLDPRRLADLAKRETPEVACMLFSSGTTGKPKAVMLTHENLIANNEAIRQCYAFNEQDTIFGLLPFFHSYGLCVLHLSLLGGARFLMVPRFHPAEALRAITEHNITILMLVPEMFRILARSEAVKKIDWSRLRLCLTGGGPASPDLRRLWKDKTGCTLYGGYGLTEHAPVVSIGIPGAYKENSVGYPLPGVEVRIADGEGKALPPREEGEILVKSPSVMKGYFRQEEATAEMIDARGWLHTGDVGWKDDDECLFVSGRAKDIIIVAGENVLPQEVEDALGLHPAVAESAVVGMADEVRGEVPAAFVVLNAGQPAEASDLRAHLRDHLASHKIPKEIRFVESLPKTPLGKVLRRELQKQLNAPG